MARNDRFGEAFERFNANLLRLMGLERTAGQTDDRLDHYRQRLEEFARQSQDNRVQTPPKRQLPPPATSARFEPTHEVAAAEPTRPFDQFDGLTVDVSKPGDIPVAAGSDDAGATVRGADGGYGTFAVLQPRVSAEKTRRTSVRSVPKTAEPVAKRSVPKAPDARRQDAEARVQMRKNRPRNLNLVRTDGGFLVPDKPAALILPEVPLPPAPPPSSGSLPHREAS